mmetsp:Transcript_7409/g.18512  ORF Transcript_7409/g.18512 Transcript_7409/m.18512 type:complete len:226 (-) Transcript_7409:321-998(-)
MSWWRVRRGVRAVASSSTSSTSVTALQSADLAATWLFARLGLALLLSICTHAAEHSAASPKKSPRCSIATCLPSTMTPTCPESTKNMLRAASPCRATSCPCLQMWCFIIDSTSRRSTELSPWHSLLREITAHMSSAGEPCETFDRADDRLDSADSKVAAEPIEGGGSAWAEPPACALGLGTALLGESEERGGGVRAAATPSAIGGTPGSGRAFVELWVLICGLTV